MQENILDEGRKATSGTLDYQRSRLTDLSKISKVGTQYRKYMDEIQSDFSSEIQSIIANLEQGKITLATARESFSKVAFNAYKQAYQMGGASTGNPSFANGLLPSDIQFLSGAVSAESKFWNRFAKAVVDGTGKLPSEVRAEMYADSLEAQYWNGYVEAAPDDSLIYWDLGIPQTDHCEACLEIAAHSPYTKDTLPTVPRAGDTDCGSKCLCELHLEKNDIPKKPTLPPGVYIKTATRAPGKEDELAAFVTMRDGSEATKEIKQLFSDLFGQMNTLRIQAALAKDKQVAKLLMQQRSLVNAEIIKAMEVYGVRAVPRYAVGEMVAKARELSAKGLFQIKKIWSCPA